MQLQDWRQSYHKAQGRKGERARERDKEKELEKETGVREGERENMSNEDNLHIITLAWFAPKPGLVKDLPSAWL